MAVQVWVYTCTQGRGEEAIVLTDRERPTCTASTGQWEQIALYESYEMDIVSIVLITGMALLFALGFISGGQR